MNLWHTGRKELDGACQQIEAVIPPEAIIKRRMDLIQIAIGGCQAGRLTALTVTVDMDLFDQSIQLQRRDQTGIDLGVGSVELLAIIRVDFDHHVLTISRIC